jgi:peptidoglycan hydrolase-like protein with peptidoglycan-binding domain
MTRTRWLAVGGVAVVVAGVAAMLVASGGSDAASGDRVETATSTATVETRDLVVTDSYDGELGFGDAREYVTDRSGVVTTVAKVGTNVASGGALFSVDFEPTVVLQGTVPAWRALDTSVDDGPDVAQLEQALVDLGNGSGVTVDEHFDSSTASAVEAWEESLGRSDPDGTVDLGDVVFAAGALRVSAITSDVGTRVQSGTTVVTATPTAQVVMVDLEADRSDELEPGTKVVLTLPDGAESTGTVATIGAEVEEDSSSEGAVMPGASGGPTVPVTITLDDASAAAAFDTGSVDVAIERSREEDATAVPVTALIALVEGGYALQVVDPSQANGYRLVGVEVGTFADGYVGVTGEGIEPGVEVVVPA